MEYRNHIIAKDGTGYAPKNMMYSFFLDEGETYAGSGESITDCKEQIDELLLNDEPNLLDAMFMNPMEQLNNLF